MTKYISYLFTLLLLFASTACVSPTSTNTTVVSLENPNNEAAAVQAVIAIAANRVLAKNPGYTADALTVADGLSAIANGTEASGVSAPDIAAVLANPKLSMPIAMQADVSSDYNLALGLFNTTFQLKFPTLKLNYNIFVLAFANGIYSAEGKPTVPLPVIPWPPAATAPSS